MDVRRVHPYVEVNVKNIEIIRYTDHPAGHQGALRPADGTWQLVIDKDGLPHFFVSVQADGREGWLDIDDLLPGELTIGGFVGVEAGDPVDDATAAEAAELLAGKPGRVCPV